jgi:hypothetical protein
MLMMMSIEMKFVDDFQDMLVKMMKMMKLKMKMLIMLVNDDEMVE